MACPAFSGKSSEKDRFAYLTATGSYRNRTCFPRDKASIAQQGGSGKKKLMESGETFDKKERIKGVLYPLF